MFLDVDDAGGLAVAFAMQQLGEAKIVALGIDLRADRPQVAATSWRCAAAITAFYTGSTVPLGAAPPRDGIVTDLVDYSAPCAASRATVYSAAASGGRRLPASARDPTRRQCRRRRYRLRRQPRRVAGSGPDAISPLTGRELVVQKVRVLVVMGGGYPNSDGEHNLQGDIERGTGRRGQLAHQGGLVGSGGGLGRRHWRVALGAPPCLVTCSHRL